MKTKPIDRSRLVAGRPSSVDPLVDPSVDIDALDSLTTDDVADLVVYPEEFTLSEAGSINERNTGLVTGLITGTRVLTGTVDDDDQPEDERDDENEASEGHLHEGVETQEEFDLDEENRSKFD